MANLRDRNAKMTDVDDPSFLHLSEIAGVCSLLHFDNEENGCAADFISFM
jgi:hypothetical protein